MKHAFVRIVYSIGIVLSFYTFTADATPEDLQRLLSQTFRPTMEELVSFVEKHPEVVETFPSWSTGDRIHLERLLDAAPDMLILLETVYPNGTYAFLGRDMHLAADILESIYLHLGQRHRVKLLGFSTQTKLDLEQIPVKKGPSVSEFLQSNGFDREAAIGGTKPFVFVDSTSYGESSQSTFLVAHVFRQPMSEDDRRRLGMNVGVLTTALMWGPPMTAQSSRAWVQAGPKLVHRRGTQVPAPIVYDRLGTLTHHQGMIWHGPFELPFVRRPNGNLSGTPMPAEKVDRMVTLSLMWTIHNLVGRPEFQDNLLAALRRNSLNLFTEQVDGCTQLLDEKNANSKL